MRPFNVEIFDRNFNFIHNYTVEQPGYKFDYLTPVENTVVISFSDAVAIGQYIILSNNISRYEGVISSIQVINKDFISVGFYGLNSLFDCPVFVDIDYQQGEAKQGQKSIESIIYSNIKNIFIDGHNPDEIHWGIYDTDNLQKIPGLTLTKTTDTMIWNVGLSYENSEYNYWGTWKGNLSTLIINSLKGCNVGVITTLDITNHAVNCTIGVLNSTPLIIEADLPQILKKNIVENDTSMMCNKYILIQPTETGDPPHIYYRHPSGLWDRTNADRITPVIFDIGDAMSDITQGDTVETRLFNKFGALNYVNLIELTTTQNTYNLQMGDIVNIIVGNKTYVSMLTGYEIANDTIKYIFGMLRLDLTKILKGRNI